MKSVEATRKLYEVAKLVVSEWERNGRRDVDTRPLLTNAEAEYRAALIDAAERRFDSAGIKVGETLVTTDGTDHFVIVELEADVAAGRVKARSGIVPLWAYADELRPYTDPEAKQMVLYGPAGGGWAERQLSEDRFRITLSGITPADLDAMKPGEVIEGTFKIEGVGK